MQKVVEEKFVILNDDHERMQRLKELSECKEVIRTEIELLQDALKLQKAQLQNAINEQEAIIQQVDGAKITFEATHYVRAEIKPEPELEIPSTTVLDEPTANCVICEQQYRTRDYNPELVEEDKAYEIGGMPKRLQMAIRKRGKVLGNHVCGKCSVDAKVGR